jgi:hypothetical protein
MTGKWPTYQVDHINGIKTDNRWKNLRDVNGFINQQNRLGPKKNNKSGFLGVTYMPARRKWRATIRFNGNGLHLGMFDKPELGFAAYIEAKRRLHPGCTI